MGDGLTVGVGADVAVTTNTTGVAGSNVWVKVSEGEGDGVLVGETNVLVAVGLGVKVGVSVEVGTTATTGAICSGLCCDATELKALFPLKTSIKMMILITAPVTQIK